MVKADAIIAKVSEFLSSLRPSRPMLKNAVNDIIAGGWTVFGLAIAWAVLPEGETRDVVGSILMALSTAWLLTGPLRWREEE